MNLLQKVFVVAYDCPHRKTYDVLTLLKAFGYKSVTVFTSPMTYKKTFIPLLQHRPNTVHFIDTKTLCDNLNYRCINLKSLQELILFVKDVEEAPVLIAGAGLLPNELLNKINFINVHPGYLPYARGLDAFKWSLLQNLPIGVTAHLLGQEVDSGVLIHRLRIFPQKNDTFHSLAYKVYEEEINLLVKSIELYKNAKEIIQTLDTFPAHKRMPNEIEKTLDVTLKTYYCDENLYNCWE